MLQDLTDLDFDTYFDVASSNQQPPPTQQQSLYDNNRHQPLDANSFDLFSWNLITSPLSASSSEGYLSPPQKDQFFFKKPLFQSLPGINIPSTPTTELNPTIPTTTTTINNLPSPPLDNSLFLLDDWTKAKNEDHEPRNWRKLSSRNQQLQQPIPNTYFEPGKQLKKVAHNAIERRYRNNINDRIHELKNVVPALYKAKIREKGDEDCNSSDSETLLDGVQVAKKLNKATILKKATEYIDHLKYTNNKTEQENQILQQIIAQMPGGHDILQHFLLQKSEFEKNKQDQLARERRETQEREKVERQRMLRERAAQRAALAQLLPKPERKPYRRRQSSKTSTKSEDGNKMFMAAFMCLVFFTASPSTTNTNDHVYNNTRTINTHSFNIWHYIRYFVYAVGIVYICFIPFILRWLRPRPVHRKKNCLEHHHYATEVPTAWSKLYTNLVSIINKSTKNTKTSNTTQIIMTLFDLFTFTLSLCTPRSLLVLFHKNAKPVGCPEELAYSGAWIRLNEVECLGANPDITRLGMLHSCMGMLSQLHKMKRDEKHVMYYESSTMARVYATVAMQLELCLPPFIPNYPSTHLWRQVNKHQNINLPSQKCRDQVLRMLQIRNGFDQEQDCRNIFYSFVLPYVTSPLDLVLYWQQLESLEQDWHAYLNGVRPVFSEKQIKQVGSVSVTTTAPGHMLQWWIRVGLALESLGREEPVGRHLSALAEYTRHPSSHPSSNLLCQYQTMIFHMLQAASALQTNKHTEQVPQYLQKALKERRASFECIDQIATTENFEASVLVLSLLAVHLRTLKALIHHSSRRGKLPASQASVYIAELRDQVLEDLESPYTKSLSVKCRKFIQSFIAQADDTLCL